jgi:hypothetical protein
MIDQKKKDLLDEIEYELVSIKDQDILYQVFRKLAHSIPNDYELGEAIRILFTSNTVK